MAAARARFDASMHAGAHDKREKYIMCELRESARNYFRGFGLVSGGANQRHRQRAHAHATRDKYDAACRRFGSAIL